jgi:PKD repeat protein
MNTDGSGIVRHGDGWDPAWSPDGTWIAFTSWNDDGWNYWEAVYIMKAGGSGGQLFAQGAASPAWMPGLPAASFAIDCRDWTCTFDASASLGAIEQYAWEFGDQAPASGKIVTHTYGQSGYQTIALMVTDANGLSATERRTIYLNQPPVASFTVSCDGLTCNFDASQSSDADGRIVRYEWAFGDGGSAWADGSAMTHVYAAAGTYSVVLTVSDNVWRTDTQEANVTPPAVHIGDLNGTSTAQKGGAWSALVTIAVHDAAHGPVVNAIVRGVWGNGASIECTTTDAGQCTVLQPGIPGSTVSTTFKVLGVTAGTAGYDAAGNHDLDNDSNGTSITVKKR